MAPPAKIKPRAVRIASQRFFFNYRGSFLALMQTKKNPANSGEADLLFYICLLQQDGVSRAPTYLSAEEFLGKQICYFYMPLLNIGQFIKKICKSFLFRVYLVFGRALLSVQGSKGKIWKRCPIPY